MGLTFKVDKRDVFAQGGIVVSETADADEGTHVASITGDVGLDLGGAHQVHVSVVATTGTLVDSWLRAYVRHPYSLALGYTEWMRAPNLDLHVSDGLTGLTAQSFPTFGSLVQYGQLAYAPEGMGACLPVVLMVNVLKGR